VINIEFLSERIILIIIGIVLASCNVYVALSDEFKDEKYICLGIAFGWMVIVAMSIKIIYLEMYT
jgi:hypothetical protein